MKKVGVDKARIRLNDARVAFDEVKVARDFGAFRAAWFKFLMACNGIAEILETSARSDPRSRQWFGGKKNAHKKDELLSYMHQARNVEEHGIEPVAEHQDERLSIVLRPASGGWIKSVSIRDGEAIIRSDRWEGEPPDITYTPPHVRLVDVEDDRYGTKFAVPKMHLSQPITDNSPVSVGALWLAYSETLIDEAATYIR